MRLAAVAAGLSLLAAACAATPPPPTGVRVQTQGDLVVQVVASVNDAGRAPAVIVSKDGVPAVTYLLLTATLKPGQVPPAVIAGVPQPPAVILATKSGPVWSHTSVTKQETAPAQGVAEGIAFKDGTAGPTVHTAVALDGQDKYHVAWSTAAGLFYNAGPAGSFGDPQNVVGGQTYGAAIALAADGSPWISFYQGSSVRAAHLAGGSWALEDVAPGTATTGVVSAVGIGGDGEPMVAYGDGQRTKLARRAGGTWTSEDVPGDGGYGVSMAVDGSGNPHLAYYDRAGNVHHAHSAGGGWEVTDVATVAGSTGPSADWSTGIALDDQGVHYVTWADTAAKDIGFATNAGGAFQPTVVAGSLSGVTPSIGVSGDGKNLAIAWYSTANADLEVATSAAAGLAIAYSPPPAGATSAPPPSAASCSSSGTKLEIAAKNVAFDKDCLAAPAGKPFTVTFDNQEAIPHNFAIYTDSSAAELLGGAPSASDIVIGPKKVDYQVKPLEKGTYYFQCDIHPTAMFGTFVAD